MCVHRQLSMCVPTPGTGSPLMIVTEYMGLGALDSFLRVSGLGPWGMDGQLILGFSLSPWWAWNWYHSPWPD